MGLSRSAALLLAFVSRASAGPAISSIAEIGPHYKVVTIEKSVHPQNKLVAYTLLDEQCRIRRDPKQPDRPAFDFYWLMDGTRYKRVNPVLKSGIRRRLQIGASPPKSRDGSFSVRLKELESVEHDLGATPLFWVGAKKTAAGCVTETRVTLGPSDKNAVLLLESIYSEADMTGRFSAKVKLVALKGFDQLTGKRVVQVYRAK